MASRSERGWVDDEGVEDDDFEDDEDDLGIGDDDAESEEPDDDEADRESVSFFRVQE